MSAPAPHSPFAHARNLFDEIRGRADEIEQQGQLPSTLVRELGEAGFFRLAVPRTLGGAELDLPSILRVLEELARADGSTGWCVMIAALTGMCAGHLDETVAKEVFAGPLSLLAGVAVPTGRARPVDGGYEVTGRWTFASASRHATWLVGGCLVADEQGPVLRDGAPQLLLALMPAAQVSIHDTWQVTGLAGTGSHDMSVSALPVPAARTFSLFTPPVQTGPLYAYPPLAFLASGVAAVALGIARAAIDEATLLLSTKTGPAGQPAAAKPITRIRLAEAEAALGGARAYLYEQIQQAWDVVLRGEPVPVALRAGLRVATANAATGAARAVDLAWAAAGSSAAYTRSPLQRFFRDVHVATQHAMVGADALEMAGAVLLGQPADPRL